MRVINDPPTDQGVPGSPSTSSESSASSGSSNDPHPLGHAVPAAGRLLDGRCHSEVVFLPCMLSGIWMGMS